MASSPFSQSFLRHLRAPIRKIKQPPSTFSKRYSGHYEPRHGLNQPSGWVFGEKPQPPGQPRPRELWQYYTILPMIFFLLWKCTAMWYGSGRLEEWGRVEARRRMEERGDFPNFTPTLAAGVNFHPVPPDAENFKPAR
ncbi:hypothetical protein BDY24DRAFT_396353 [Mrakia frigida]|uniref:uncharacterized protein n=1 Tax=Mrakia frigida TaxID=29902 RepID=UPI003FCC1900